MPQPVREFPQHTVVMMKLWPNPIIQQQSNTLATRQLVTRGPTEFELAWMFFGYASDDDEIRQRRLLQANLMGPSGHGSADDGEAMKFSHAGAQRAVPGRAGRRGRSAPVQKEAVHLRLLVPNSLIYPL